MSLVTLGNSPTILTPSQTRLSSSIFCFKTYRNRKFLSNSFFSECFSFLLVGLSILLLVLVSQVF